VRDGHDPVGSSDECRIDSAFRRSTFVSVSGREDGDGNGMRDWFQDGVFRAYSVLMMLPMMSHVMPGSAVLAGALKMQDMKITGHAKAKQKTSSEAANI